MSISHLQQNFSHLLDLNQNSRSVKLSLIHSGRSKYSFHSIPLHQRKSEQIVRVLILWKDQRTMYISGVCVIFLYVLEKISVLSLCLNLLQLLKLKLNERISCALKRSKSFLYKASMLEQTYPDTQHLCAKGGWFKILSARASPGGPVVRIHLPMHRTCV